MNRQSGAFGFLVDDPVDFRPREGGSGLSEILLFLRRRWLMMAAVVAAMMVGAGFMLVTIKPSYTATAELTLIDPRQGTTPIADLLTGVPLSRQLVEQEITTMRSKAFMIEVVKSVDLPPDSPIWQAELDPLPVRLVRDLKAAITRLVQQDTPAATAPDGTALDGAADPAAQAGDAPPPTPEALQDPAFELLAEDLRQHGPAADLIAGRLQIAQRGNGFVIAVSAQSTDPVAAAKLANATAGAYPGFSLGIKGEAIEEQVQLLSDRVEALGADVQRAETAVVDYGESVMGADDGERLSQQIAELNRRLIDAEADILRAEAQHAKVLEAVSRDGPVAAAAVLTSPILGQLRAELSRLRIERSRAGAQFGADSPQVGAIDAVIARLDEEIGLETNRIVAQLDSEARVARSIAASIDAEIAALETQLSASTRSMVELGNLRRIADANRVAYEQFLRLATESAQYKALQQPTIRLLSYAEVPQNPSAPRYLVLLAGAGLAGLALAVGLALAAEAMNNRVVTAGQLRGLSGLPVIGSFGRLGALSRRRIEPVLTGAAAPRGRAQHRLLAEGQQVATFLSSSFDRARATICVTSAVAGEGRSVTALLLARAFARKGESVLLIEADGSTPGPAVPPPEADPELSAPIVATRAGFDRLALSELVSADASALSERWKATLIENLARDYQYIVIDAAPALASSGGLGFVNEADAIVVATRWNATARQAVEGCVQRLRDLHAKNIYMVLTMVNRRAERKYEYRGFARTLKTRRVAA
ncbi:GumC family protein [Limimaricola pyoseonensis]|uniref:Uncharacterized protein involved in exopolysaccharide biosynthesis n=1 Tax=Limimaricola pyoseonensis TaxID=521013 RepID=A0A1G7J0N3_9RHOB|nr:Wzz/FepE/Etk N-terminal domain-containing protein [Limimaricola pyoseonensis]SDF18416.1 Uncharacterized protein involved in exopolysaccharide biosynthesis [Limimaricola pyoseonensis]